MKTLISACLSCGSRFVWGFLIALLPASFVFAQSSSTNVISGEISIPGEQDVYTFTLEDRARYYFDSLTSDNQLHWSLDGPLGSVIDQQRLNVTDASNASQPVRVLEPGFYRLTLGAISSATNAYAFRFVDVASAGLLTLDTVVSNRLSSGLETHFYQFSADAGDLIEIDRQFLTSGRSLYLRLLDPFNNQLVSQFFNDAGPIVLPVTGNYVLAVEGYISNAGPANYAFMVGSLGNEPPPVFAGTPIDLTDTVGGSLTSPTTNDYVFSLAETRYVLADNLTNSLNVRWYLRGPAGVLVNNQNLNGSDQQSGLQVLELAPGDYQLSFYRSTAGSSEYRFRFLDLGDAVATSIGASLEDELTPITGTTIYRFEGQAGSRIYLDMPGDNVPANASWRLFGPYHQRLAGAGIRQDLDRLVLPLSGSYYLAIEGYHLDTGASPMYRVDVVPVMDTVEALSVGGVVSGSIDLPGQTRGYLFSLASPARLYFDSRTSDNLEWTLTDQSGQVLESRRFNQLESSYSPMHLPAGDYRLEIGGNGDDVGSYTFRLFDLAGATLYAPGTPLSASLNPANETDAYRFSAMAGEKVFLDFVQSSGAPNMRWRLLDPFDQALIDAFASDSGPVVLPVTGEYTFLVEGHYVDEGLGSYTVNLVPVVDGLQSLASEGLVTGMIATSGQQQTHTFTLNSARTVYFDSRTNVTVLRWSLEGPTGLLVNNRSFNSFDGSHAPLMLPAGNYTLTVTGLGDETSGYGFVLKDLAVSTPVTLGLPVSRTLDPANRTDVFRFTASAGDEVYLDALGSSGAPNLYWRLLDPYGRQLMSRFFGDEGPLSLEAGGLYTLLVEGHHADTGQGSYNFNVVPVVDEEQPLVMGETIDGVLDHPGQEQRYTFSLSGMARVFMDYHTNNSQLRWALDGPAGRIVNNQTFSSQEPILELVPGDYELIVYGNGDHAGPYHFRLIDLAAAAPFNPGTPVSGALLPARAMEAHRFEVATAGDVYDFQWINHVGMPNAFWRLLDPYGQQIFNRFVSDAGTNRLTAAGTYTLLIIGSVHDDGTGSYEFNVIPAGNIPVPPFTGTPLTVGTTVAGNLSSAASTNDYVFGLPVDTVLFFDALTNSNVRWSLEGPPGFVVSNRSFASSDSADGNSRLALPSGQYRLRVFNGPGDFAFRFLNPDSAAALTPGIVAAGTLTPARATMLYQFEGMAGDAYYYRGEPYSGFGTQPHLKLVDPYGGRLFNQGINTTVETFGLPYDGTYIVAVEGRVFDNASSGSFAFNLVPVTYGTNDIALNQVVSGQLSAPGERRYHRFQLANPTVVFFDTLVNSQLRWSLFGPQGEVVGARTFQSSDSVDGNPRLDLPAGDYLIEVDHNSDGVGDYSFRLLASSSAQPFQAGELVEGEVAPAIGTRLYRFSVQGGQRFFYDGYPRSGFSTTPYYRVYGPLGNLVHGPANLSTDVQSLVLNQTGDHIMAVEGRYIDTSDSGQFTFLWQPVVDHTNTMQLGDTVNGSIDLPGQQSYYFFTVSQTERVIFDARSNTRIYWRLTGPQSVVVNQRYFLSSDSVDGNPLLELVPGDYVMNFYFTDESTGSYAFRLLPEDIAVPFVPGQLVGGTLAPAIGSALHSFTAQAGDRMYYDGRPTSGFGTDPWFRIYDPFSRLLFGVMRLETDVPTFTIPYTGTYLMSVEGRYLDNNASGDYSFVLFPNPLQPPVSLFDTNVAPDLMVSGVTVNPASSVESGDTVNVLWTTSNEGTAAVIVPFSERVTVRNLNTGQLIASRSVSYDVNTEGPILPNGTRTRQLAVSLPNGPAGAGNLEFTVTTDALNQVAEENDAGTAEANNAASVNLTSVLADYPDLRVAGLAVMPANGWATGSVVTVQWAVTNTGTAATLGSWLDSILVINTNTGSFLINTTTNYDANQPGLGDIAPGDFRLRELRFSMPASVQAQGGFVVLVTTDSAEDVFEYNALGSAETNNTAALSSWSAPDLVVTDLAGTGNDPLRAGDQLFLNWNILNAGNVAADRIFYERLRIRNSDTGQTLLETSLPYNPNQAGLGAIAAGATRARQYAFTLPDGPGSAGNLAVSVEVDVFQQSVEVNGEGTAEANNVTTIHIPVAPRPYPDLIVTNVMGPLNGSPGETVPVVWTLANQGTVAATGTWTDQVFLSSDAMPGNDTYLSALNFTGTIGAGALLVRTQMVTLPNFGTGARYLVVETDVSSRIFEEDEDNNAGVAGQPLQIPAALTLNLSPSTVAESGGSQAALATVTRNTDTTGPLTVNLSSSRPSRVVVPGNVTFASGAHAVSFFVGVVDDMLAQGDAAAMITAQAAGHASAAKTLTVRDDDRAALSLELSATILREDDPSGINFGLLSRNAGTNQALTVQLSTDRPGALAIPGSVSFAPGETALIFLIDPVDNQLVTGTRAATIYASATGYSTVSVPLTILDNDTVSLTLQLSESSVAENAINPVALATISRSPVSSALQRVRLSTNNGGLVQLPSEAIIPANQSAVSVPVLVRDDQLAYGDQTVTIRAEALSDSGAALPNADASAALTIRENDGPTLSLQTAAAVIEEGASTLVTVRRNTPPTNQLAVSLSSLPAGQVNLPATVVMASGMVATNFVVTGVSDGVSDGVQEVGLTAQAAGHNSGNTVLTVTDIDVPDLALTEVTAPATALSESTINVIWGVTNSGLATATGPWTDEVYLARDPQGAQAVLVASVVNPLPLAERGSYIQSRTIVLPAEPRTYWILVRSDAAGEVLEGSERNNARVSAAIEVQPAYRATVSTDVDTALSGTPIPMTGRTFATADGAPAPYRVAQVRIRVKQTVRTLQVLSDSQGNFSTVFQPIPGEAGLYTISADHPQVMDSAVQDQFTLLGMAAVPWELDLRLAPNVTATVDIAVRNLSPLPLTGLTVAPDGLPLDFSAETALAGQLPGGGTNELRLTLSTTLTTPTRGSFNLVVASLEGAQLRIPVNFFVTPPTAQLVAAPARLEQGMLRGTQTLVSFDVSNQGGVSSGELSVALPVVPWLSLASSGIIPPLAPGGKATVVLALNPGDDLPLTRYDGNIVINGAQTSLTVPFGFRAMSEARGDLLLTVTDEHTYYADGAPNVVGASLTLTDFITGDVVAEGVSDGDGEVLWTDLPEGTYVLEGFAARHSPVRASVTVKPGVTTEQEVFMLRQEVTYEWTVVPSEITDHYKVVLQPLFETEVPQPNLVVENPVITPLVVEGQVSQFAIRLRNTGLVALERVRIPVPSHPSYDIQPLVNEIERLPAQTTVSVPVTIRLREPGGGGGSAGGSGGSGGGGMCPGDDCVIQMPIDTRFRCGENFVVRNATVSLHAVCVPDTGCDFTGLLDTSSPTFFSDSLRAQRAEWECMLGNMDECDKARIRGYLESGDLGSLSFPPGALPPPLSTNNFGLSAFCVCGPQSSTNTIFAFGTNLLQSLGFNLAGGGAGSVSFVAATVPGPCNAPFGGGFGGAGALDPIQGGSGTGGSTPPGVCARVRLELSQDITMTRSAFIGTLIIDNGRIDEITDIQLALDFRDANGMVAGDRFAVRGPVLSGITAIDGSGALAGQSSGSVSFTFIPNDLAAPFGPAAYQIGGTLQFTLDGQALTVPLLPGEITVLPEARLQLEYFQQRDVFSDDPFTPELEPAEPFSLGLRILNVGAGLARNFNISAAAPRIIDNEKGLLVQFELLGARLGNAPLNPSFNLNVGNIEPGASQIVLWDMTSTLQGKFIEFLATFEHLDAFGETNLSLIESVDVHEMIHVVRADRAGDDTLPDFLVNDTPDPDNAPDIVYLSEGYQETVALGSNGTVAVTPGPGNLTVQLTASMPPGWAYLRMPNPGPDLELTGVTRSDGKVMILGDNVWTTDRTFPSSIPGAIREKTLHLFDHDSTGIYSLHYGLVATDTNAPSSAVAALPAASATQFAVAWDGDDGPEGSGIAYFDIYVSVDGAAATNWLSRSTQRSALFSGVAGRQYAFYSVAVDHEGNVEVPPPVPDTQTVTSGGDNTPPSLLPIGDITLTEGNTLNLTPTAIDSDVPAQTLTFRLLSAPAGALIQSSDGIIRWPTGEAQGGQTYPFILEVTDNGLPSLSATQTFRVIVLEDNQAPRFVETDGDVEVDEETLLSQILAVTDPDLPPNQFTWQLQPGAPAGMTVNPLTGALMWLPGEADGPGEYPVTVRVTDNGTPARSAMRTLRVIVREANRAPVLDPISNQGALVETTVSLTATATDPDEPAQDFVYSLVPGAPRGAFIDRDTGEFFWTPTRDFALSTNQVTVRVTDTGFPSMSDERTFVILVGDLLDVSLGSSIVLAGEPGRLPIEVLTTTPATNLAFFIEIPSDRLVNVTLDAPQPPLQLADLMPLGSGYYYAQFGTTAGQPFAGTQVISNLRFDGIAGGISTFVPVRISAVEANQPNGQPVPRVLGSDGRVVYLGEEPLLEVIRGGVGGPDAELYLYSQPRQSLRLESALELGEPVVWNLYWQGGSSNLVEVFDLGLTNSMQFFRGRTP